MMLLVTWMPETLWAQSFGRWWWDGSIGFGQRQNDGLIDGERVRRFSEQQAELSIGLNGYVVHPAIGDFRIATDLLLGDYEGARLADADRVGAELLLNFLQRGSYPVNLYFRRNVHDNVPGEGESPFTLVGIVDASERWGGRFRARKGPMRGMLVGVEHTDIEFLNPAADLEVRNRQFLAWSRSGRRLNNNLRIERRDQDFGTIDLRIEDLTATFDQNGNVSDTMRWEFSGLGVLRDTGTADRIVASEDYRARGRIFKDLRQRDQLELRLDLGVFESDLADRREARVLSARYRLRLAETWEIAPFANYAVSTLDGQELQAPRAGLSATWRGEHRKLAATLAVRLSVGEAEQRRSDEVTIDSLYAYALSGSLRHGETDGFHQEVEAEISHNEIRFDRGRILELPEATLPFGGLSAEDFTRVLGGLGWRWDSKHLKASLEWLARDSTRATALETFSSDSIRIAVQAGMADLTAHLDSGRATVDSGRLGEQEVIFTSAAVSWHAARLLRLSALYRFDRREVLLAPDIESQRLELGLTWHFGAFVIEAQLFERSQRLRGGSETVNRGFRWLASRRMAGWLPVVTGAERRGVIR